MAYYGAFYRPAPIVAYMPVSYGVSYVYPACSYPSCACLSLCGRLRGVRRLRLARRARRVRRRLRCLRGWMRHFQRCALVRLRHVRRDGREPPDLWPMAAAPAAPATLGTTPFAPGPTPAVTPNPAAPANTPAPAAPSGNPPAASRRWRRGGPGRHTRDDGRNDLPRAVHPGRARRRSATQSRPRGQCGRLKSHHGTAGQLQPAVPADSFAGSANPGLSGERLCQQDGRLPNARGGRGLAAGRGVLGVRSGEQGGDTAPFCATWSRAPDSKAVLGAQYAVLAASVFSPRPPLPVPRSLLIGPRLPNPGRWDTLRSGRQINRGLSQFSPRRKWDCPPRSREVILRPVLSWRSLPPARRSRHARQSHPTVPQGRRGISPGQHPGRGVAAASR